MTSGPDLAGIDTHRDAFRDLSLLRGVLRNEFIFQSDPPLIVLVKWSLVGNVFALALKGGD